MEVAWSVVILLGTVLVLGAITQSVAGFGLAVVGVPFTVLLAPELLPGAMLVASLSLPLVEVLRRWRAVDVRLFSWAMAGRLATTPIGVLIVAWLSPNAIAVIVGVMVLLAVAASLWALEIKPSPQAAFGAGVVTGVSGTAASIGGPFLALVMQREPPARVRATLATFFVVGAATALASLALVGELSAEQVRVGLIWTPFALLGAALSIPVRRRVRPEQMRPIILAVATVAGATVLVRALLLS